MTKKRIFVICSVILLILLNIAIFFKVGDPSFGTAVNITLRIFVSLVIDTVAIYSLIHLDALMEAPREILESRKLILSLAKNDFKQRFAGSYLGIVWAFVQPIVTVLVYWFVFQVGFRASNVKDYPFVLFLVSGIVPWFFFSDGLNGGTSSLMEYSYLVKKVVFNIDVLPVIKILSAMFVHLFFILVAIVIFTCYGMWPGIYTLQLVYYVFCTFVLVSGLAYLCSAIAVFFRDMLQIINVLILQVGMWLTPIMWDATDILSPTLLKIFKINPVYYIVDGFRDTLLRHEWFWMHKTTWTLYFWFITYLIYAFGIMIFRKLKVHFADVL